MLTVKEALANIPYHLFEEACAEEWMKYNYPFPPWSLREAYENVMRSPAIDSDIILLVHDSDNFCESTDTEINPECFEISSLFYESNIREIQEKYGTGGFLEILRRRIRTIDTALENGVFLSKNSKVFDTGILPKAHDVAELQWEEISSILVSEGNDSSAPELKIAHDIAVLFFDVLWYGFSKEEFEETIENARETQHNPEEDEPVNNAGILQELRYAFHKIELQDLRYRYEVVEHLFAQLLSEEKA